MVHQHIDGIGHGVIAFRMYKLKHERICVSSYSWSATAKVRMQVPPRGECQQLKTIPFYRQLINQQDTKHNVQGGSSCK